MVYVGTIEYAFRNMIMFHMATDSDINELHKMADKIGVKQKWFQEDYKNSRLYHPHYDICKSKKALAIKAGAKEVSDIELVKKCFPNLHSVSNSVADKIKTKNNNVRKMIE